VFACEALFTLGLEFPFQCPGGGIDGVKPAAIAAKINDAVLDRGRRGHPYAGKDFPFLRAGCEINRVQVPVRTAHEDGAIGHRRR